MYKIITMEREFASGGNEIGRKVAKRAGIGLYDRNCHLDTSPRPRDACAARVPGSA